MWDLRGLDLKKLDIRGWDDPSEGLPPTWAHTAGPEAKDAGPQEDVPGGQAPASSWQPPALQDARGEFAQMLEQAISRCVSKLGRMQEERLNEMFHEQDILLSTSLRRFQNQLAEHTAAKTAASSAIPVTTATEVDMRSAVANIEAKVSRLAVIVEEGQGSLDHYLFRTKQVVSDAIGEKLDTTLTDHLNRLRTGVLSDPVQAVPAQDTPETLAMETSNNKRATSVRDIARQYPTSARDIEQQLPSVTEDEEASHGSPPFRASGPMKWIRNMISTDGSQADTSHRTRPRQGRTTELWLQTVVRSPCFEMASGLVVVANVLVMVIETDRSFGTPFPRSTEVAIEGIFLTIYTTELLVRIGVERSAFLASRLNMLDVFLVLYELIEFVMLVVAGDDVLIGPIQAMRLLRLQRVFRLRRLFRLMPGTNLLLESLRTCGSHALLGSALVVFVYILVAAILVGTVVSTLLRYEADALSDDEITYYRRAFGSVGACMVTLYQSLTSGREWAAIYTALAKVLDGYLRVPFIAYHFGFQFLLVNILNSVFVQKVMSSTTEFTQVAHYNTFMRDRRDTLELLGRCEEKFGPGELMNYKEFLDLMLESNVHRLFDERNTKFKEAGMLYAILAKPVPGQKPSEEWRHTVDRKDFLEACMRLKHDHRVLDMVIANTSHRLRMEALQEAVGRQDSALERVQKQLDILSHHTRPRAPPF